MSTKVVYCTYYTIYIKTLLLQCGGAGNSFMLTFHNTTYSLSQFCYCVKFLRSLSLTTQTTLLLFAQQASGMLHINLSSKVLICESNVTAAITKITCYACVLSISINIYTLLFEKEYQL